MTQKNNLFSKIVINLVLVTFSILTCLVAVEGYLRFINYNPMQDLLKGRELILKKSLNEDVQYELTPNASGLAWRTQVKINSLGFRDKEYDVNKGDKYRIIAIGDSITFGNSLLLEDTYPKVLEEMLATKNKKIEVLNFGVGGYSALNAIALLEYKGLKFKPDLIVYCFCVNDLGVVSPNLEYIERLEQVKNSLLCRLRTIQFLSQKWERLQLQSFTERINKEESFGQYYKGKIIPVQGDSELKKISKEMQEGLIKNNVARDNMLWWYTSPNHMGFLDYAFKKLSHLRLKNHFEVIIILIPILNSYNADAWDKAYQIVSFEAKKYGFGIFNMNDDFKNAGFDKLKIIDDIHPNKRGHVLIAKRLYALSSLFFTSSAHHSLP